MLRVGVVVAEDDAEDIVPRSRPRGRLQRVDEGPSGKSVAPGGQVSFTRIRVRLEPVPVSGKYRFIHPYGEETIEELAATARLCSCRRVCIALIEPR